MLMSIPENYDFDMIKGMKASNENMNVRSS